MADAIHWQYIEGFRAGAESVISMLEAEYPGLEEPEFGGPVSEARADLERTLAVFNDANAGKLA